MPKFEAAPINELRLFGGLSILDSKYSSFPIAPFVYANPAVCTVAPPNTAPDGVAPEQPPALPPEVCAPASVPPRVSGPDGAEVHCQPWQFLLDSRE